MSSRLPHFGDVYRYKMNEERVMVVHRDKDLDGFWKDSWECVSLDSPEEPDFMGHCFTGFELTTNKYWERLDD